MTSDARYRLLLTILFLFVIHFGSALESADPVINSVNNTPEYLFAGDTVRIATDTSDDTQIDQPLVGILGTNYSMNISFLVNRTIGSLPIGTGKRNDWDCADFSTCLDVANLTNYGDGTTADKAFTNMKNRGLFVKLENFSLKQGTTVNFVSIDAYVATDVSVAGEGFHWGIVDCASPETIYPEVIETNSTFQLFERRFYNDSGGTPWTVDCVDSLQIGLESSNANTIAGWEADQIFKNVSFETAENFYYDYDTTGLSPGTYTYTVYSNDSSGNNATPVEGNFTVIEPINVSLVSPANNTVNKTTNNVTLSYNVTGGADMDYCALIINGTQMQNDTTITKDTMQSFTENLSNGNYSWSVNCKDIANNTGNSEVFNIVLDVHVPNITSINPTVNISLLAGTETSVDCNMTVSDGNGAGDIASANATLRFHNYSGADDNNFQYSNSSCTLFGSSGNESNYTCGFNLQYYAVNGTWTCETTAVDNQGLEGDGEENTSVLPLFALETSTNLLEYGDLKINQTSPEFVINVTNLGNRPINVSVWGYGSVQGDDLSMVCQQNNISIDQQKFSSITSDYNNKTPLSSSPEMVGFTLQKQDSIAQETNSTFWQLSIPVLDPVIGRGQCSGNIIFHSQPA